MGGSTTPDNSAPNSTTPSPHNSIPVQNIANYGANGNTFTPAYYSPEAVKIPVESPEVLTEDPTKSLKQRLTNIFIVSLLSSLALWVLVGAGFPWFIYIPFTVSFVECIIYGVKAKEPLFITGSIYVNINIMLFLTYLATGGGYPWFIYPLIALTIIPGVHYLVVKYRQSPTFWLYLHTYFFLMSNSICFFAWMISSLSQPYPWFIFPWCGWGVFLIIHYNFAVMKDPARMTFYIMVDLGIMLTVAIRFAIGPAGVVIIVCAAAGYIVCAILKKKGWLCYKNAPQTPHNPQDPQSPPPTEKQPVIPQYFSFVPGYQHLEGAIQQHIYAPPQQQPQPQAQPQPQSQPQQQQQQQQQAYQTYQQQPPMYTQAVYQPQFYQQPPFYQQQPQQQQQQQPQPPVFAYPASPVAPGYVVMASNPATSDDKLEEIPLIRNSPTTTTTAIPSAPTTTGDGKGNTN